MQTTNLVYLCLVLFLFFQSSIQKSCFQAVHNRITYGQLAKYLPSFRNVGQLQKQYACTQNFNCFKTPNQFYYYYGQLQKDLTCTCVEGFQKQCIVAANSADNVGLRSIFINGRYYGNEEFVFSRVKFTFLLQARKISSSQTAHQWYLEVAHPIE